MGKQKEKENNRKLSKAEQKRKEQFEAVKEKLKSEGYEEKDLTVGIVYANIMAVVLCLPVIIPLTIAYLAVNNAAGLTWTPYTGVVILLVFCVLVVVHELIHGITWAVFAKEHWKTISFGFMAEYLTPYCTCREPLKKGQYIVGALMPTIVLGLLPAIAAIMIGSWLLFVLSAFMILSGGGDLTIILKMLMNPVRGKEVIYIDHPYQGGVVAFCRK